jgi:hypothetical protein
MKEHKRLPDPFRAESNTTKAFLLHLKECLEDHIDSNLPEEEKVELIQEITSSIERTANLAALAAFLERTSGSQNHLDKLTMGLRHGISLLLLKAMTSELPFDEDSSEASKEVQTPKELDDEARVHLANLKKQLGM